MQLKVFTQNSLPLTTNLKRYLVVLFLVAWTVAEAHALPLDLIEKYSKEYRLDKNWIIAIIMKESEDKEFSSRYEPSWKYLWFYRENAERLGISQSTEKVHQQTSWGIMHIVGGTARELQYKGMLPALGTNDLSLKYGCMYLRKQLEKYGTYRLAVAAYNAGSARHGKGGMLYNEKYLDQVSTIYRELTKE